MVRSIALALVVVSLAFGVSAAEREPSRRLPELERYHYACVTGDDTYHLIRTDAELRTFTALFVERCQVDEKVFLKALAASGVDFSRDALVLIEKFHGGTGMARASLTIAAPKAGVVTAAITVTVPPPPHTPDVARFPFAFAVDKAVVNEVIVTVGGAKAVSLQVSDTGCH